MPAIDFPDSPTAGQLFTYGTRTWKWDGTVWGLIGAGSSNLFIDDLMDGSRVDALEAATWSGDVTGSGGTTTIAARAVTFAKMQAISTARFLGRVTASTGDIEQLTAAQAKALLAIAPADVTVSATSRLLGRVSASSGPAEELTAAQTKTLLSIVPADMAVSATSRVLGRVSASAGPAEELTAAQTKTLLAIVPGDVTGFDTQVRTSRLDQMATPTGTTSMGGQFVSNVGTPFFGTDAANKTYVDGKVDGRLTRYDRNSGNPYATVANTNTLTQLVSVATPAALAGDEIVLRFTGDMLNNSGANTSYIIGLVCGGTTMANITTVTQATGAARGKWYLEVRIDVEAVGGSPVIVCSGHMQIAPTGTSPNWGTDQPHAGMLRTTAVNLASASTFVINITPANANASIDWRLISYTASRFRP